MGHTRRLNQMCARHVTCKAAEACCGMQAPISVYTSGKGSSAAGLTATVVKDSHGEFFLEVSDGIFSW